MNTQKKMKNTSDNATLFNAIDGYDFFTNSQKTTLQVLLNLSEDNIVNTTVNSLCELVHITRSMMYINLSSLEEEKFIIKRDSIKKRIISYELNIDKLDTIKSLYNKKLAMMER